MQIARVADRWLGRLSGAYSFWPLVPAGVVGVVTGWLSSSIAMISQFGAFGWWSVGLIAFLVSSIALFFVAYAREKLAIVRATERWAAIADNVNPLDTAFNRKRIKLLNLVHPVTNTCDGKTFTDCDLLGPGNVAFLGNLTINGVRLLNCDIVIIKDQVEIYTVKKLNNCNIVRGTISGLTIFVFQNQFDNMRASMPNIVSINYERRNA